MEGGNMRVVDDGSGSDPGPWSPARSWRLAVATLVGSVFAVALVVLALGSAEEPPSNPPEAAPATTTTTTNAGGDLEPLDPHSRIEPWVNRIVDGQDPILRCVGDAALVMDNAPLPEGFYTLRRAATSQAGLGVRLGAVRFSVIRGRKV